MGPNPYKWPDEAPRKLRCQHCGHVKDKDDGRKCPSCGARRWEQVQESKAKPAGTISAGPKK